MRVPTHAEEELIGAAYRHIQAVALGYDKNRNGIDFSKIRIGREAETGRGQNVPAAYFPMAAELARVLSKDFHDITPLGAIAHAFSPLYKEKSIQWLFRYCIKNRVQPSEFAIDGFVWVDHDYFTGSGVPHTSIEYGAVA